MFGNEKWSMSKSELKGQKHEIVKYHIERCKDIMTEEKTWEDEVRESRKKLEDELSLLDEDDVDKSDISDVDIDYLKKED